MIDPNEHSFLMLVSRGILLVLGAISLFIGVPELYANGMSVSWGMWLAVIVGVVFVVTAFFDSAAGVIVSIILLGTPP